MIKKYRTSSYSTDIDEVEVIRETDKCVFLEGWRKKEQREQKHSGFAIYHDTWDAAYLYLLSRCETQVRNAEADLERAKDRLEGLRKLKERAPQG